MTYNKLHIPLNYTYGPIQCETAVEYIDLNLTEEVVSIIVVALYQEGCFWSGDKNQ